MATAVFATVDKYSENSGSIPHLLNNIVAITPLTRPKNGINKGIVVTYSKIREQFNDYQESIPLCQRRFLVKQNYHFNQVWKLGCWCKQDLKMINKTSGLDLIFIDHFFFNFFKSFYSTTLFHLPMRSLFVHQEPLIWKLKKSLYLGKHHLQGLAAMMTYLPQCDL